MSEPEKPAASRRTMLHSLVGTAASLAAAKAIAQPLAGNPPSTPKLRRTVYLDDFLDEAQRIAASTDRPRDCTAALERALATGCPVEIGAGHYALDALRLPNECSLTGHPGTVIHQASPDRPAVHCVSDVQSGQLAGIRMEGMTFVGHPAARAAVVLLEARLGYAIWRSRFAFFAQNSFRALEVQASDANNVFECEIEVVSEGTSDTAVLVRGGTYNRYHLFLTRTRSRALDDGSNGSVVRVVAENTIVIRGQTNHVYAVVESISAPRAADQIAISDRGFGNVFHGPQVSMLPADRGKLRYAFGGFDGTIFISPQIIGDGTPHPFAPTSNLPFTVIGGRSGAAHKVEATFDGSDPDHDLRNITFIGPVRDFTALPTHAGTVAMQRLVPLKDGADGSLVTIAATTQVVVIDAPMALPSARIAFVGTVAPRDGWMLSITTTHPILRLTWPENSRFSRLPARLVAGQCLQMVYQKDADTWFPLG